MMGSLRSILLDNRIRRPWHHPPLVLASVHHLSHAFSEWVLGQNAGTGFSTSALHSKARLSDDWMLTSKAEPGSGSWTESLQSRPEEIPRKKEGPGKITLYRAKWIRPIRLLVRLKLLQFGGIVGLTIPLAEYSQQGTLALGTILAAGAVVGGSAAASTALWFYSRRLIGEMALILPNLDVVQLSVLDFWGNRENLQFDIRDILPPLKGMTNEELDKAAQQIVIPLDVLGGRQFFLSLRHGYFLQKDVLFSLLNGSIELGDLKNQERGPALNMK